ncbi:metal tolerance protein 4 [Artemisia annua]|uniref:Metal tolerance protein 4 n=1 Tax=Artemisia annua TaxID=35608 RepID=A0A2U1KBW0_ARTAN|nr:metal tolerance protein 4 [Artemisia annua]
MVAASVVKLGFWLYCKSSGNEIVRAYAKVTSFIRPSNLNFADVLGDNFYWWLDPVGAIILAD